MARWSSMAPSPRSEVELSIVTVPFDAAGPGSMVLVLAVYGVRMRSDPACGNVDLCASVTAPGRYVVDQQWDSAEAQRADFNSPTMVEMAEACRGLLSGPPD